MYSDLRAELVSPRRQIPRVLESQADASARNQRALPFQMPTERMVRAALLNGWPVQRVEATAGGTHTAEPLLTA